MKTRTELLSAAWSFILLAWGAVADCAGQAQPAPHGRTLATVNGEAITQAEFEAALRRLPSPPTDWPEARRKALYGEVLAVLIDDVLIKQYLRKHVPPPERSVIEKRWAELHNSLRAQGRSIPEYCKEMGQTEQQLVEEICLREQLKSWDAALKQATTEDQLRTYYEANREMFEGVLIRASHIVLKAPGDTAAPDRQALVEKLNGLRGQILNGLDFAEAARKHSEDPSRANGGDVGFFPPRPHDLDPFIRAASRLKQGEVSEVVHTPFGCHLIKVTERKPGKPAPFAEIKEIVRDIYVDEQKAAVIHEQRKTAKVHVAWP